MCRRSTSFPRLAVLAFATLFSIQSACVTTPVTGRQALVMVDEGEMAQLGARAFSELEKGVPESRDEHAKQTIYRVVKRIVQSAGPETASQTWQVKLFESKDVNAFALPGGKVGVYSGILAVAGNEAALAAVLGHEIAHVVARHSAERMSTGMLTNLGLAAADAAFRNSERRQSIMAALGVGAAVGVALPFSRRQEAEADEIGHVYMARAGYDPREAPRLWVRMGEYAARKGGGKPPELLSSHPADASRIQALEANLSRAMAEYAHSPQYGIGEHWALALPHGMAETRLGRADLP